MGFITAPLWKIGTVGAGIVCAVLMFFLATSASENRALTAQRTLLSEQINDPKTGYVVRLAQAATNVETLKVALVTQRRSFEQQADVRNAALRQSEERLRVAQALTRGMEVKLTRFLATKPQGTTLEDRVRDIDARAMSELVQ